MIKNIGFITIWSDDYRALANWYEEVLGLKRTDELNLPEDTGVIFDFGGGTALWIGEHSEVSGKNKDRYRSFVCYNVESVGDMYEKLVKQNVEFIRKPSLSPTKDYYAATAVDPDGNLIQFESESL